MNYCTLKDKVVTTRKTHRCEGCLHPFPSGSILRSITGLYDRAFQSFYLCQDCDQFLKDNPFEDGFERGEIAHFANGKWAVNEYL